MKCSFYSLAEVVYTFRLYYLSGHSYKNRVDVLEQLKNYANALLLENCILSIGAINYVK